MARLSWLLASLSSSLVLTQAATVTHDFNITWTRANPDGAFERPVIGINGKWPIPTINVNLGDRVVINVNNQLGNQSTSLHFHGLFMNGTSHMDGPTGVTQCAISPGDSFTYDFHVSMTALFPVSQRFIVLTLPRLTNLERTGTTLTPMLSIPMV